MTYYQDSTVTLHHGDSLDVLRTLADGSVDCCVTSPPYFGLRDYGHPDQIGAEKSPAEYVERLRVLFAEVRRVLADDGTLWLNIGDSYVGSGQPGGISKTLVGTSQRITSAGTIRTKPGIAKNLLGIPWRVAFALQDDGWILRNAIVWEKGNAMPESVTDRLSTRYEMIFLFSKSRRYWFDLDAIREPHAESTIAAAARARIPYHAPGQRAQQKTRGMGDGGANPGDVWMINTVPFSGARTGRLRRDPHDPDAPAYGMQRIASPTCPQHVSTDRPDSNGPDDARAADAQSRTPGSDAHPDLTPIVGCAPTPTQSAQSNVRDTSGLTLPGSVDSASPRNTESHRTDPAPETTEPYKPSAQTPNDTERNGGQPAFDVQQTSKHESNTAAVGSVCRVGIGQSNAGKCSCSWIDNTEKLDHFAVFPPELPRRCIVAGCKPGGTVLDPFHGSGTTGMVATRNGRKYVGIELNKEYLDLSLRTRLADGVLDFDGEAS